MKSSKFNLFGHCAIVLALVFSSFALANTGSASGIADPYGKIERITADLLQIIGDHQQGYPDNQGDYFNELTVLLNSTVDFKFISRSVMGRFAKQATPEQRNLFIEKFRRGLVETYGRGLINYGNQKIHLVDRKSLQDGQRRLTVKQEIRSEGDIFPLHYSMARKKTGEWMVINVVINGINLGKTFRSQFAQAAQKSGGDLDTVIAEWTTETD
jgi:phospholipid transport system substrate-binding protein